MLTQQQVIDQQNRFETFIANTNLVKIGERVLHFVSNENGRYNVHNYIALVLKLCANVHHDMYHPNYVEMPTKQFYGDLLKYEALRALVDRKNSIAK